MKNPLITVITPTTGKDSLSLLIDSLESQTVPWVHTLLWDNKRENGYLHPDPKTMRLKDPYEMTTNRKSCIRYSIVIPFSI